MASTLVAGNISGVYQGYVAPSPGSLTPDTFGGITVVALVTGLSAGRVTLWLNGDATAFLAGKSIVVDGVTYSTIASGPTYTGSRTEIDWTYDPGNFVVGNSYTVDVTSGAPVDPVITSAATVINLVNTTLAHTITADKTIASTTIAGGADAASFEINGTATLRFASNAASAALGPLVVDIEIADTDGLTDTQTITVTVKAIISVGRKIHKRAGSTSTVNVSLTDIPGVTLQEDDLVVIGTGIGALADVNVAVTSGYTEWSDIYENDGYDANLGVFAKFMGSTPDTTVTLGSTGNAQSAAVTSIRVYRGVDTTTPLDVAVTTASGIDGARPNPPAITPVTAGAMVVAFGAQAAATMANLASSDLDNFHTDWQADTQDVGIGAGEKEWSGSGAVDPAAFTGGSSNAANSNVSLSLALRPAWTDDGGITSSASGTLPLSGAATGTLRIAATASGSLPLTGSATSTAHIVGTASGTLLLSGSAAGTVGSAISGSAAGTLPLTGGATSKASISATASGTLPLTGSSSATVRIAGNASGTLPLTGSATSAGRIAASAAGSFALTGSAAATVRITGTGAGSLPLTGNAAGTALTGVGGSAAGTLPLTGGASGALRIVAAASGTLPLSGSAIGTARIAALAAGTFDLSGSSTAGSAISGQASGLLDLTGESFGTTAIFGQASGDLPLTGEATGAGSTPAPIPAARIITPLAQRTVLTLEAIDRFIQPVALQTMLTPDARSVIVTPPQRCCTIILAGYEETDMSSEYFQWPDKLAPAVIFYGVDWARRLGEATIVSHNFQLVGGSVTLTPRTVNGTETSVSIAGGTAGSVAVIIASVVASDGETHAIRVSIDIA